ncbi:MAG TPA: hypothetical protein VFK22_08815 [Candidatus Dormibacteraeota bacterium]|nr:hypothetical protein [Candidatus Dormibacteraeota bacterium]
MNANEEVMWQRLKDRQREAEESSRLSFRQRLWLVAGPAMRRTPRRSALRAVRDSR